MPVATPTAHERLLDLLEDLPPESLAAVEHFVKFLHAEAKQGRAVETVAAHQGKAPFRYPTVPVPASCLDGLVGIMPPVDGDALVDTEALYDEV